MTMPISTHHRSGAAPSAGIQCKRRTGRAAAGSLIALLLWIYYSAQIFFFGAVFTRQFALRFGREKTAPAAAPTDSTSAPGA
mgnify:CR=1 FL=1